MKVFSISFLSINFFISEEENKNLLSSRNGLSGSDVISDTDKKESFDLLDINTPRLGELNFLDKEKTADNGRSLEVEEVSREVNKKKSFLGLFGFSRGEKRTQTTIPKSKIKEPQNTTMLPVKHTGK